MARKPPQACSSAVTQHLSILKYEDLETDMTEGASTYCHRNFGSSERSIALGAVYFIWQLQMSSQQRWYTIIGYSCRMRLEAPKTCHEDLVTNVATQQRHSHRDQHPLLRQVPTHRSEQHRYDHRLDHPRHPRCQRAPLRCCNLSRTRDERLPNSRPGDHAFEC